MLDIEALLKEKRHFSRRGDTFGGKDTRRDTLDEKRHLHNVETYLVENRHLCCLRDTFSQEGDTCVGLETPLEEQRHLCRSRDTFGGK